MAKAKATPKKETSKATEDDGTITREESATPKAPSTPKASDVEKSQSFTAAFKNDAHAAADHWLAGREEVSREENDAGDAGVEVTITCK